MNGAGLLVGVRVTHQTGSVDDIADVDGANQREAVESLLANPDVSEAFALTTCNRAERYVVARNREAAEQVLKTQVAAVDSDALVWTGHEASLEHLLRVAAGLESVILGEDQIIGQFRDAREDARNVGGVGSVLEPALTKALHVGERARTETAINEGIVSLGSAAARVLQGSVDLEGSTALVVGAGEMGTLTAQALVDRGVESLLVANRTVANAEALVESVPVDGAAISIENLDSAVPEADVVVTAVGADEPVLGPDPIEPPVRIVDLGQPRNVDPAVADCEGVALHDLDALESIIERTRDRRADAARAVEAIVKDEFARLLEGYKRARADEVIAAMYESADRIKDREVTTALTRLEGTLSAEQREVIESMADALVGQLLAPPTESLREAASEDDWDTIYTALTLFDPEFGPEDVVPELERDGIDPSTIASAEEH